jgi:hypothetical protein
MNRGRKTAIALLVAVATLMSACGLRIIRGSGNTITEDRDVSGFNRVRVAGIGEVIITQGDEESLTIETDDNLMEHIVTEVRGDTLNLEFPRNTMLDPSRTIEYRISVIDLTGLISEGGTVFKIDGLNTGSLEITLSGGADVEIGSIIATDISVEVNGAGDLSFSGQVETQDIRIDGIARYNAVGLESQEVRVEINGGAEVRLRVAEALEIEIRGGGYVGYYGNPLVTQDIQGTGNIERLGE